MDYIYEMPSVMLKECSKTGTVERFEYDTFTYDEDNSTETDYHYNLKLEGIPENGKLSLLIAANSFEDEFGTLERVRHYLPAPILERLLNAFAVEFPADGREPVYMKEENIRKYIGCSRVICRDVEDGKIEKALQSFGEGQIDGFFC